EEVLSFLKNDFKSFVVDDCRPDDSLRGCRHRTLVVSLFDGLILLALAIHWSICTQFVYILIGRRGRYPNTRVDCCGFCTQTKHFGACSQAFGDCRCPELGVMCW